MHVFCDNNVYFSVFCDNNTSLWYVCASMTIQYKPLQHILTKEIYDRTPLHTGCNFHTISICARLQNPPSHQQCVVREDTCKAVISLGAHETDDLPGVGGCVILGHS